MATILTHGPTCDGYNARCLLSNGEQITFHFLSQPTDLQASVDSHEVNHLAVLAAEAEQAIQLEVTPE